MAQGDREVKGMLGPKKSLCLSLLLILCAISGIFLLDLVPILEEYPLSQAEGLAVHGQYLYCGVQFHNRVNVYDRAGRFQYGFDVPSANGAFRIRPSGDHLEVASTRTGESVFFYQGKRAWAERLSGRYLEFYDHRKDAGRATCTDSKGTRYQIKNRWLCPRIVKVESDGTEQTLVHRWYFWPLLFPIPTIPFLGVGTFLLWASIRRYIRESTSGKIQRVLRFLIGVDK